VVHVSIWETDERAQQMSRLRETIVDTRRAYEKAGGFRGGPPRRENAT
jgi:hypothetical protein